jgi:hypothetical protein
MEFYIVHGERLRRMHFTEKNYFAALEIIKGTGDYITNREESGAAVFKADCACLHGLLDDLCA